MDDYSANIDIASIDGPSITQFQIGSILLPITQSGQSIDAGVTARNISIVTGDNKAGTLVANPIRATEVVGKEYHSSDDSLHFSEGNNGQTVDLTWPGLNVQHGSSPTKIKLLKPSSDITPEVSNGELSLLLNGGASGNIPVPSRIAGTSQNYQGWYYRFWYFSRGRFTGMSEEYGPVFNVDLINEATSSADP